MKIQVVKNPTHVAQIRNKLKETGGYCPCVPPYAWNENTRCICKEFQNASSGTTCHCGLYIKVEE